MTAQEDFIRQIVTALDDETAVRALFLGGSHGRGTQDRFSDLDFVGLVEDSAQPALAGRWREAIETISPLVYWSERRGPPTLINAITADWLRVDLWMIAPASFAAQAQSRSGTYAHSTLRCLVDRDGVFASLPAAQQPTGADRARVEFLISEFIRVLGLIAVGIGRGELVLGVTGAGLLRDLLTRLMIEQTQSPERGGMLHLSRNITSGQMEELLALPYPSPTRAEVLEAHWAMAKCFFPRAKAMAAALDLEWPASFEQATAEHLKRSFGAEFTDWRTGGDA